MSTHEKSFLFGKFTASSSSQSRLQDDNFTDTEGKVKTRLLSMWNNVKFGMKLKTNFSKDSPVWLLGKCYRKLETQLSELTELGTDVAAYQSQNDISTGEDEGFEGFKRDFISRIWLTYRREFPILDGSNFSSDCGWGCMLRSGQMLIAQALICHFLGRDWRWNPEEQYPNSSDYKNMTMHKKVIKWFGDKPTINSPFSIHSLVSLAALDGKRAGDWYGPGYVAHLFRKAILSSAAENREFENLSVYVAQDCAVYMKDVMDECCDKEGNWKKALILLIPVRMGVEKFNSIYAPCLTTLFSIKQCIGVIGGRPKHSLYFVGYQDEDLIHLDPHYCQEIIDVWNTDFDVTSFHCRSPRKMHISKMDPSSCIGFYCKDKEDFLNLVEIVQPLMIPRGWNSFGTDYPLLLFYNGYIKDVRIPSNKLPPPHYDYSIANENDFEPEEYEEFEIL